MGPTPHDTEPTYNFCSVAGTFDFGFVQLLLFPLL